MSLQSVKIFLSEYAPDIEVAELDANLATVTLAAQALGVVDGQIAKTLSMRVGEEVIVLVMRGDARIDNRKFKQQFGTKARMLEASDVERITGHPVGGVCPFGLAQPLRIFCDVSLKAFSEVFPAGGAPNAAIRVAPERMAALVGAQWVDIAQV
ncbi:YbaK/prolyl-tRNA synthetase associated family protein [Zymomonas mobilis subsp. mobilis ZM4 = ATCC 31821]|uniref:YbaK/prolyl-tRNA synthetase associated region n=1 Tax=Zymomonas mobilis subsp. mobilis (strain ATCC 31821 / ZM4 / CP4) TaxID=264203 RepID=Q5NL38_ZYMMO|nr:YbaK/EbsC family protein [Zymomonas mobilis]AAV90572.1 YbaK/prolyl-tRNA synthetase associated region [Zymomonas mobilis subsp. mobilis ZM4 = ATCC 31821]AVZ26748.1 YbaK/prolyl-tRNA synthetase associated family protein [Zymomonas mobilis subsp. mobilis]AVZ28634.1 YbaK/prolyl-tRNA synthetase associated family protein [Zymomonas mobilis subsp. mobilis]AVZ43080.1 YbaK/prolyl-tRNA synthetase associated family protein [Zymomonas mobilis subsp. mobilis ZM4 = ATCC 31821]UBQ07828.1 YbaK/EbsC family p